MSDTDVQEAAQESDFFEKVQDLLERLVPPSSVVVTTISGETLELPGAIPARQQVKVFRYMKELLEYPEVNEAISGINGNTAANVIDLVISLVTDEKVMEQLGAIFTTAYPNALPDQDPLDVLPLEELVTALVPFSERFIKKLGGGLVVLGTGAAVLN